MKTLIGITGRKRHGKDTLYKVSLAPRLFDRLAFADSIKAIALAEHIYEAAPTPTASAVKRAMDHLRPLPSGATIDVELLRARLEVLWENHYQYFGAEKTPEVRRSLQEFGTEIVKELLDPGYWLTMVLKEAHLRISMGDPVAITDVRVPEEAKAVQGDRDWLRAFYANLKAQGRPTLEPIEWMLTHYQDEGSISRAVRGVLPRTPGLVLKVHRPGMPDNDTHATEAGVDLITADATVENHGKAALKAQADQLLDRLGVPNPLLEPALT